MRLDAYDPQDAMVLAFENAEQLLFLSCNTWRDLCHGLYIATEWYKVDEEVDFERFKKMMKEDNPELEKEYLDLIERADVEGSRAYYAPYRYGERRKFDFIPITRGDDANRLKLYEEELKKDGVTYRAMIRPEDSDIDWDKILNVINQEKNFELLNQKVVSKHGKYETEQIESDWDAIEGLTEREKRFARCFLVPNQEEKCFEKTPTNFCLVLQYENIIKAKNIVKRVDNRTRKLKDFKELAEARANKDLRKNKAKVREKTKDKGISR